jgi:hypothetical protein
VVPAVLLATAACATTHSAQVASPASAPTLTPELDVPFRQVGSAITIDATVNGERAVLALALGGENEPGLALSKAFGPSAQGYAYVVVNGLDLGKQSVAPKPGEPFGVDGVLNLAACTTDLVEIDYLRQRLQLYPPEASVSQAGVATLPLAVNATTVPLTPLTPEVLHDVSFDMSGWLVAVRLYGDAPPLRVMLDLGFDPITTLAAIDQRALGQLLDHGKSFQQTVELHLGAQRFPGTLVTVRGLTNVGAPLAAGIAELATPTTNPASIPTSSEGVTDSSSSLSQLLPFDGVLMLGALLGGYGRALFDLRHQTLYLFN